MHFVKGTLETDPYTCHSRPLEEPQPGHFTQKDGKEFAFLSHLPLLGWQS